MKQLNIEERLPMVMIVLGVSVLIGLIVLVSGISMYNKLIALKNQVDLAWANIDVILKQRFDEIPSLIEVLEQAASYEKSVIEKVAEARTRYGSARNEQQKLKASQELSLALSGVFAIGEAYPDLKSNAQFTHILSRLSALEDQLSDRRESYNDGVTLWNTTITQFPEVMIAPMFGFQAKPLFKVSEAEKARPSLKMNLGV
jgi:LemA protein